MGDGDNYYDRPVARNSDGTPLYCVDYDITNEREAIAAIRAAWQCDLHPFGRLCPVDYYAVRDGRLAGVLEIKTRTHASGTYQTVFLNVRKWLALSMCRVALGCPAVYVVKFTDDILWIDVMRVDASQIQIGGCKTFVKSTSDVEPVIHVPVADMKPLRNERTERKDG